MKISPKKLRIFASIFLCLALLVQSSVVFALDKGSFKQSEEKIIGEYVKGEAVVFLNDNAGQKYLSKAAAKDVYGAGKTIKSAESFTKKDGSKLNFVTIKAKGESTEELISELKDNRAVKTVIPNYIKHKASVTKDTYSDFQWALENKDQNGGTSGCDINPDALWSKAKNASEDAIV
ncbi:MAG: hypothetical protein IJ725_05195, partial [Ruminococcus sp.]|nr:hypothetical protein [Ruminococcus sp.]